MSWLSRLKRRFDPPPVTEQETAQLQDRSEQDEAHTLARDEEVRQVVDGLRRQRQQNHFGPLIWAALRGEAEPDV